MRVAEVISKFVRKGYNPEVAFEAITTNSIVINVDEKLSRAAGGNTRESEKAG